jgi:hypothetical protein
MRYSPQFQARCEQDNSSQRKKFDDSARIEHGSVRRQECRMMRVLFICAGLLFCGGTLEAKPRASAAPVPSVSPTPTAVLFEFSHAVSEPFWEELKVELDQNAAPISPERAMTWMKRQQFRDGMEYPEVVQVRLRGHCNADLRADWQYADGPLGWVYLIGGEIQPIAYVDCDRIGQTLERQIRGKSTKERQQEFARAVSRVVAHELTHVFQQSRKHSSNGLQRAYLTALELTKEGAL